MLRFHYSPTGRRVREQTISDHLFLCKRTVDVEVDEDPVPARYHYIQYQWARLYDGRVGPDAFGVQQKQHTSVATSFGRGLEDTLTLTQAQFCPAFMPHEETTFMRQLLSFAAEKVSSQRASRCMLHIRIDIFVDETDTRRALVHVFVFTGNLSG